MNLVQLAEKTGAWRRDNDLDTEPNVGVLSGGCANADSRYRPCDPAANGWVESRRSGIHRQKWRALGNQHSVDIALVAAMRGLRTTQLQTQPGTRASVS